jgi:hypothetical protein
MDTDTDLVAAESVVGGPLQQARGVQPPALQPRGLGGQRGGMGRGCSAGVCACNACRFAWP